MGWFGGGIEMGWCLGSEGEIGALMGEAIVCSFCFFL